MTRTIIFSLLITSLFQLTYAQTYEDLFSAVEKRYEQGKYEKAIDKNTQLLQKIERKYPNQKLYLAWQAMMQAKLLEAQGQYPAMNESLQKALQILETNKEEDAINYGIGITRLADVYMQYGHYGVADTLLYQCEQWLNKKNIQDKLLWADIKQRRSWVYINTLQLDKAKTLLEELSTYLPTTFAKEVSYSNASERANKDDVQYREANYANLFTLKALLANQKGDYVLADSLFNLYEEEVKRSTSKKSRAMLTHYMVQGNALGVAQQYEKAIEAYTKALDISKRYDKQHLVATNQILRLQLLAGEKLRKVKVKATSADSTSVADEEDMEELGDAKAQKKKEKLVKRYKKTLAKYYPENNIYQIQNKALVAEKFYIKGKEKKASKELNELLATSPSVLPNRHPLRLHLLGYLYSLHHYIEADDINTGQVEIDSILYIKESVFGKQTPASLLAQMQWGDFQLKHTNRVPLVRKIYEVKPEEVLLNQVLPTHQDFVKIVNWAAYYYAATEDFDKALGLLQKGEQEVIKRNGKNSKAYGQELIYKAEILAKLGKYVQADSVMNQAVEVIQQQEGKNSLLYADALATQARLYATMGFYSDSEKRLRQSMRIYKRKEDKNVQENVKSMEELATLYTYRGRYTQAEKLLGQIIANYKEKYGEESQLLISPLNSLAEVHLVTGEYDKVESLVLRSADITQKVYGDNTLIYAQSLEKLVLLYITIGDYEKAKAYLLNIIKIKQRVLGKEHIALAHAYNDLALVTFYLDSEQIDEAEKLLLQAKSIISKNLTSQHPLYADVLKTLATLYIDKNDLTKAESHLQEALGIYESKTGESIKMAQTFILLGDVAVKQKETAKAVTNYEAAEKIYKKLFDKAHPSYVFAQSRLAQLYYVEKDYEQANKIQEQVLEKYLMFVQTFFPAMSEREKASYWHTIKPNFEFYCSLALQQAKENPEWLGNLYNYNLATKAILLSSSIKVKTAIMNSNDEELKRKYETWVVKKEELAAHLVLAEESEQVENLGQEVEKLEKELTQASQAFKEAYRTTPITWKEVQKNLKEGEVAVEMIRYHQFDRDFTDSVKYVALIITPDTKDAPDYVLLKNGNELETENLAYYRNRMQFKSLDDLSYKKYWKPIAKKIGNSKQVYISSDGVYNQINLSSLYISPNRYVIDQQLLTPVTSTKELVIKKNTKKDTLTVRKAVLIGNPQFYKEESEPVSANVLKRGSVTGKRDKYNKISYLEGTKTEVENINLLLEEKNWEVTLLQDEQANEANIKKANNPTIFHIATHGFFEPDRQGSKVRGLRENRVTQNAFLRAGLLLEGAGDLFAQDSINYHGEDGVFTAYEAVNLNFDKTELVVLSACETGVGEVQVGEGVYGLQRAFQIAGANVIIMSLFKVSDEATEKLMVTFYQKWLESGDKHKAFREAQKEIKLKYKHPIYWGAFSMIGLE